MRNVATVGALSGLFVALMLIASPAAAFHGGPYTAEGTAKRLEAGALVTYAATLEWGGWWEQAYTVTIKDAAGNVIVEDHFPGFEVVDAVIPFDCKEIIVPYLGGDSDADSDLLITGYQILDLCNNTVEMHYEGAYEDFLLSLDVWSAGPG